METHDLDQFIRVEVGTGEAILAGDTLPLSDGSAMVIPAGVEHNVVNTGAVPLQLYSLYTPPEHKHGTVHPRKEDVVEEHFDGTTSFS